MLVPSIHFPLYSSLETASIFLIYKIKAHIQFNECAHVLMYGTGKYKKENRQ